MDILHYIMFIGQDEVQDLLIYAHRHDIYDAGKDNIFGEGHMHACRKFVHFGLYINNLTCFSGRRLNASTIKQLNGNYNCLRLIAYTNRLRHRSVYCLRQYGGSLFFRF